MSLDIPTFTASTIFFGVSTILIVIAMIYVCFRKTEEEKNTGKKIQIEAIKPVHKNTWINILKYTVFVWMKIRHGIYYSLNEIRDPRTVFRIFFNILWFLALLCFIAGLGLSIINYREGIFSYSPLILIISGMVCVISDWLRHKGSVCNTGLIIAFIGIFLGLVLSFYFYQRIGLVCLIGPSIIMISLAFGVLASERMPILFFYATIFGFAVSVGDMIFQPELTPGLPVLFISMFFGLITGWIWFVNYVGVLTGITLAISFSVWCYFPSGHHIGHTAGVISFVCVMIMICVVWIIQGCPLSREGSTSGGSTSNGSASSNPTKNEIIKNNNKKEKYNESPISCDRCGSREHTIKDCPHDFMIKKCSHCGSKEHSILNCPHLILFKKCSHCGSKEHSSDKCPNNAFFLTKCRHCGSKEHNSLNCPHGTFDTKCERCGSKDHSIKNCPHRGHWYK